MIFQHQEDPRGVLRVASVVVSYEAMKEPVYGPSGESPLYMKGNTGIIVTHNIFRATDIITANPSGFPL